jgi:hypothetical protein
MMGHLTTRIERLEDRLLPATGTVRVLWIEPGESRESIDTGIKAMNRCVGDKLYLIRWRSSAIDGPATG